MKKSMSLIIWLLLSLMMTGANGLTPESIKLGDYRDQTDVIYSVGVIDGSLSGPFGCLKKASVVHVKTTGNDETGDGSESNPYASVQHAINIAADGDTVMVHPGQYFENVDFSGHNVIVASLYSITGDTSYISSTIIDGNLAGSVISFYHGENSSATVTGLTLRNGLADTGGGIFILSSDPTISDNLIAENTGNYYGGGIYCGDSSCPNITNNVFKDNYAAYGGAMCCRGFSDAVIRNNEFVNNAAFYGGGGLYCHYSSVLFINNTLIANDAGYYGGGLGLICSSPNIRNSIIRDNSAMYGSQIFGSLNAIFFCNVTGNWPGTGNIDIEPLFVDADGGDLNLCAQSPCIDMGDPAIQDSDSSRSDIGRYYTYRPPCGYGQAWYVSTWGDDVNGDGSSANPFQTIQHAVDAASSLDSVIVDTGIYYENLAIRYDNLLLASNYIFSGDAIDIQNTIIDGDSGGSVITFENCRNITSLIGFTIRNGYAARGGGIVCNFADPFLAHNAVIGNFAQMQGGGIYLNYSNPEIKNCTISENRADIFGGMLCENSVPIVTNTIFWDDSSDIAVEIFCFPDSAQITCSDIKYGWPGAGNIDTDPLFRNPDGGDFFIHESSPCAPANNSCNVLMGAFDTYFEYTFAEEDTELLPYQYNLSQNYPNPFNPATVIEYSIPVRTHVDISIYNLLGRRVRTIADGMKDAGDHSAIWNGLDEKGVPVATGVYLYRIKAGYYVETKKMLILK